VGAVFPVIVAASLAGMFHFRVKGNDKSAFLSSCAHIIGMLGGVAYAMYPTLLPASTDPAFAITVHNSAAPSYGLGIGIIWWSIGMCLAIGYFFYLYRSFKGKVALEEEGY
jgi:cytochrome d ubiquinol oxidase subunit II